MLLADGSTERWREPDEGEDHVQPDRLRAIPSAVSIAVATVTTNTANANAATTVATVTTIASSWSASASPPCTRLRLGAAHRPLGERLCGRGRRLSQPDRESGRHKLDRSIRCHKRIFCANSC